MPDLWTPDGIVFATAVSGNTLYMGGAFRFLGRYTGGGAALDPSTGSLLAASPKVSGTVRVIIPDGAGGWFLGGEFDHVGTFARQNLARLNPDFSVAAWNPGANYAVYALALSGNLLYVGGSFLTCGGLSRSGLAALDATTGVPTSWNPTANASVLSIVVDRDIVYAAGLFSQIGGVFRYGLAAISASDGHVTAWNPVTWSGVKIDAIALNGGTVFFGGDFKEAQIGGQTRSWVAEVDTSTGAATAWNPSVDLEIRALALSGSTLYMGGIFSNVGGQTRHWLAAVSTTTGLPTAWNANIGPTVGVVTEVDALLLEGDRLFVAGNFTSAGGQSRRCLAAVDTLTGAATPWDANAGPSDNTELHAYALAVNGGTIFAGGDFTTAGLVRRDNLGAVDLTTGLPTSWNPQPSGIVRCMAASGPKVYIGGDFLQVAFGQHAGVVAVDAVTGVPDAWDAASDNRVTALAVDNDTLYVGGDFASIGGKTQNSVAALNASTGLAFAWNPNVDSGVESIAVDGNTVYLGGTFPTAGGQVRNGLAAVDRTTAAVLPWSPNISISPSAGKPPAVHDIAIGPGAVYVGGFFDHVGGVPRGYAAAIDSASGLATTWNPNATSDVLAVERVGATIYLGGVFWAVGGLTRNHAAAVSDQGTVTAWDPEVNGIVYAVSTTGGDVCVGGAFSLVAGQPLNNVAVMNDPYLVGVPPTGPPGNALTASVAPQPMAGSALVRFSLPRAGLVAVELLDPAGRRVRSLLRLQWIGAGPHQLQLDRGDLAAGLYFVSLRTAEGVVSRKVAVMR